MRGKIFVLPIIFLLLILLSCTKPTPSPQKVTIAMGYIPNVQFAPFYVAIEKGYFRQEGIELEFNYGWEADIVKLVGTGELDFAIASGEQVLLARSQGLPIVYVAGWYHRFPVVVVSLEEKGIKSLQDLRGKKVGIPALFGASYVGWRALLKAEGFKEEDFNLQEIGYTQVESLTKGLVDAAICYAMNEPVQLRLAGYKVNVITVADRVNLISNGIMTNEKTIKEKPELVRGMVRAFLRGLRYTIENPDEAFEISKKYVPEMKEDQKEVLKEAIKFWTSLHLGRTEKADWEATLKALRDMGLITTEVQVEKAFTNEFVP
ncbi:MAG: ABC transporter substrate-binding protein [Candidatus Bathyarchaeia archaeon]